MRHGPRLLTDHRTSIWPIPVTSAQTQGSTAAASQSTLDLTRGFRGDPCIPAPRAAPQPKSQPVCSCTPRGQQLVQTSRGVVWTSCSPTLHEVEHPLPPPVLLYHAHAPALSAHHPAVLQMVPHRAAMLCTLPSSSAHSPLCPMCTLGSRTRVAFSHCIIRYSTQLILTTCQIRPHSSLWDHCATGRPWTLIPRSHLEPHALSRLRQLILGRHPPKVTGCRLRPFVVVWTKGAGYLLQLRAVQRQMRVSMFAVHESRVPAALPYTAIAVSEGEGPRPSPSPPSRPPLLRSAVSLHNTHRTAFRAFQRFRLRLSCLPPSLRRPLRSMQWLGHRVPDRDWRTDCVRDGSNLCATQGVGVGGEGGGG